MAETKVTRSLRLSPDVAETIDNMAEKEGITKSEAYRRVIRQGVELQQSDVRVVRGDQPIPDGGELLSRIEKQQQQLEEIDSKAGEIESRHKESVSVDTAGNLATLLGVLWLAFVSFSSPPTFLILPSGLLLLGAILAYMYLDYRRLTDD